TQFVAFDAHWRAGYRQFRRSRLFWRLRGRQLYRLYTGARPAAPGPDRARPHPHYGILSARHRQAAVAAAPTGSGRYPDRKITRHVSLWAWASTGPPVMRLARAGCRLPNENTPKAGTLLFRFWGEYLQLMAGA